jgi:hypothetical protein
VKRLLINNPIGPLPNVRMRYLDAKVVDAYEQALVFARGNDRGRTMPRIGSFMVWLERNQHRPKQPMHIRQVGLVDHFADHLYRTRNC